jgi:CDP-4-dehydro-6-deoxyglucose reductase, E3
MLQKSSRTIYDFKVLSIKDHTAQIRELALEVTNQPEFQFKAGQFVMLHVPTETEKPALRAYSIATTEHDHKRFRLIFKFVENGVASKFVWGLTGGETLHFTGPFGKVLFQEPPTEQIVFLNTGSGLSQHFCFLESKLHQYPNLRYRLLFGVRQESDRYYEDELQQLQKSLSDFKFEYVLSRPSSSWTGKKGYVQDFITEYNYKEVPTTFYLCGNGAMIKSVKHQLLEIDGLDKARVWAEAFD